MDRKKRLSSPAEMAHVLNQLDLNKLMSRGMGMLRPSASEWHDVQQTRGQGITFSLVFTHDVARCVRSKALILVAPTGDSDGLYLGLMRSAQSVATLHSRVKFELVAAIRPASLQNLIRRVDDPRLRKGAEKLRSFGPFQRVSQKLSHMLMGVIAEDKANNFVLRRLLAEVGRASHFNDARALQQDAVSLALKAFGAIDGATTIALSSEKTALASVRLHEDAVIEHDARWNPDWTLVDSDLTGKAVFNREETRLEIFTANKRSLEVIFGVDLIYYNQTKRSLVMVQYKMMEEPKRRPGGKEWTVKINTQFKKEVSRMLSFHHDLSPGGTYRLNPGAFYLKLVKRFAATNTAGLILSLDHFLRLWTDGHFVGERKGLRISYESLQGQYLSSTAFVDLIRSGYIGTRDSTTDHLQQLIRATLTDGRAVVAAFEIANAKTPRRHNSLQAKPSQI